MNHYFKKSANANMGSVEKCNITLQPISAIETRKDSVMENHDSWFSPTVPAISFDNLTDNRNASAILLLF